MVLADCEDKIKKYDKNLQKPLPQRKFLELFMSAFDPLTFLTHTETSGQDVCDFFGFVFESYYSKSVWPKLIDNFFYKPIGKVIKTEGLSNVVTVGVFAEMASSGVMIISDLNTHQIKCNTFKKLDITPGTLLLINCPEVILSPNISIKLTKESQLVPIGRVINFGICERYGSHLACTKYVDKSKNTLCGFHLTYYRLKYANMMRIMHRSYPKRSLQTPAPDERQIPDVNISQLSTSESISTNC